MSDRAARTPRFGAQASSRRVVVTGIGAITPIGSGRDGLWQGVRRGRSAAGRITRFDPGEFRSQVAAEINDFVPADHMDAKKARRLDRFSQLAIAGSRQALADADLCVTDRLGACAAVYLGSALGGLAFAEEQHRRYVANGVHAVEPRLALAVFGGAGATNVALEFGLHGPTISNANSCASGLVAIGEAFRLIRSGGIEVALTGGVEAPLAPLTFGAFTRIGVLTALNDPPERACRPFDRGRDGFLMGEGAGVLILEELRHALRRGARPYAEELGYGTTNDAYHMTAPLPDGREAAHAISLALDDANVAPDEVDYVNAHATGTRLGDAAEARAIRLAFGEHADTLLVSATKALHGHALGASPAIETAITALALDRGWLPPTANLVDPDPDCDVVHVNPTGEERRIGIAVKNAFGFGGINASLALRRWQE
jgi:3-oxoacyl-[acyl-carrier-protein] synthase II